jgi:hypothetical protein
MASEESPEEKSLRLQEELEEIFDDNKATFVKVPKDSVTKHSLRTLFPDQR